MSAPDENGEGATVFYEVATLDCDFSDPSFALVRIDTGKRIGSGVEGIVMSRHWTRPEATDAAAVARSANPHDGG